MTCPDCNVALVVDQWRHRCPQCKGTYVANADVIAFAAESVSHPFDLPPLGAVGPRACPLCGKPMHRAELIGVEIDRCELHGVWFDSPELTRIVRARGGWRSAPNFLFWETILGSASASVLLRRFDPPDDL